MNGGTQDRGLVNLSELDIYSTAASVRNIFNDELSILCSLIDAMENQRHRREVQSGKCFLVATTLLF